MKDRENEINAREAFIEILQSIKGVEYYPEERPENENRKTPDVDFVLATRDKNEQHHKIAVEHTIIEAHDKQKAYVNQSPNVVEGINQRCRGNLPTNRWFQIVIPPALITDTTNPYFSRAR